jgi:hypothetical protein
MGKYDDIEKREALRDNAILVPNSGRSFKTTNKGDAIMDDIWLVDYKYTEKSFTLSRNVWSKVSTDAGVNGNRMPTLKVIFEGDEDSTVRLWVINDKAMQLAREDKALVKWLHENRPDILIEALEGIDNE